MRGGLFILSQLARVELSEDSYPLTGESVLASQLHISQGPIPVRAIPTRRPRLAVGLNPHGFADPPDRGRGDVKHLPKVHGGQMRVGYNGVFVKLECGRHNI